MNHRVGTIVRTTGWAGIAVACCANIALAATPADQKAIVQNGNGGPEVLKLQTIPVLEPGAGQVLIRVYAAAVNPIDWKIRNGFGRGGPPGGPPAGGGAPPEGPPPGAMAMAIPSVLVPGADVAGIVEKVGADVTAFKSGEAVFSTLGRSRVNGLNGGYSQFVIAPASNVVPKPKNFTFEQAAGMGVAGVTAQRTIDQLDITKGQKILILGVAGGVGSSAAQIAKAHGATVIGTASARHDAYLKSIGVDQVIDYTKVKFDDQVKDVDAVLNTVSGEEAERALKTLKKGGKLASVAGMVAPDKCAAAAVTCFGGPPGPGVKEGDLLTAVAKLAGEGKFSVKVDKTFPLEKAGDAQVLGAQNHTEGKIILVVDPANAKKK